MSIHEGDRVYFFTDDSEFTWANRRMGTVTKRYDEPDDHHDEEALPMYLVRLDGGRVIEAWTDELTAVEVTR